MGSNNDWVASTWSGKVAQFVNIRDKIPGYEADLDLSAGDVTAIPSREILMRPTDRLRPVWTGETVAESWRRIAEARTRTRRVRGALATRRDT